MNGKKHLNIYYQNVRGLKSKLTQIYMNVLSNSYDIIILTETWLNNSILSNELFDDRYLVFRKDRDKVTTHLKDGGGVLIAIDKRWHAEAINFEFVEALLIKVGSSPKYRMHICVVYFRPNTKINAYNDFYNLFDTLPDCIKNNLLVIGDFNLKICGSGYKLLTGDNLCIQLHNFINLNNLQSRNNILNSYGKTLDLVLTNIAELSVSCAHPSDLLVGLDHYHPALLLYGDLIIPLNRTQLLPDRMYNFAKADFLSIYYALRYTDWSNLSVAVDVNDSVNVFYDLLYKILDKFCPKKRVRSGSSYPVWFSTNIVASIRLKHKLHKKYKRLRSLNDPCASDSYVQFCNLRSSVKKDISSAYRQYLIGIENEIGRDPNRFWSYVKHCRRQTSQVYEVEFNGVVASTGSEISNNFANFFESVYLPSPSNKDYYDSLHNNSNLVHTDVITLKEVDQGTVLKAMKELKSKKSMGPDLIPQYFFKGHSELLSKPLCIIINKCLKSNSFPDVSKTTKVTPIFKKGNRNSACNYRPISILSTRCDISPIANMDSSRVDLLSPTWSTSRNLFPAV
uniref:Uncharacterized protein n=1 Tax=Photinus pyralis TaxID=7054 RepID=A0A1Y1M7D6_PHOPY